MSQVFLLYDYSGDDGNDDGNMAIPRVFAENSRAKKKRYEKINTLFLDISAITFCFSIFRLQLFSRV